jgi:hypothetical protein
VSRGKYRRADKRSEGAIEVVAGPTKCFHWDVAGGTALNAALGVQRARPQFFQHVRVDTTRLSEDAECAAAVGMVGRAEVEEFQNRGPERASNSLLASSSLLKASGRSGFGSSGATFGPMRWHLFGKLPRNGGADGGVLRADCARRGRRL